MIDKEEIIELYDIEDIKAIAIELGSEVCKPLKDGSLLFDSFCHGSPRLKLYYYPKTRLFHCYLECGTMNLIDLIKHCKGCTFGQAVQYAAEFKGIYSSGIRKLGKGVGFKFGKEDDITFLERHLYKSVDIEADLPTYNEDILAIFDDYHPYSWENEGISNEEMKLFGIRFYFAQNKAVIPNRDMNGNLIGIRGRAFSQYDLDAGKKYMPITIEKMTYNCPTGMFLYGLYENKENIKRKRKVIDFEGEKSVLKMGSFYGRKNNIGVANLGTNMTKYQAKLLLSLGIDEITIALDKQYEYWRIDQGDEEAIKEYNSTIKKIIKIYKLFQGFCKVSLIFVDNDDILDYKDSPIDQGKEVFSQLYKNRIFINSVEELEEALI